MNTRSLRRLVLVAFLLSVTAYSQNTTIGGSSFDIEKLSSASQGKSALDVAQRGEQVPADNVIQAQYYRVGPGDVLSFLKLDAASLEEPIVISPENMLFVPRLGAISVVGMTLEQVRDTVTKLQKARTPGIQVYVGLRRARLVYVSIRGNVLSPGMYALPASLSISTVLRLAMQLKAAPTDPTMLRAAAQAMGQSDGQSDLASMRQRTSLLPPSVMRNIVVHHSDRSTDICDLQRAEATASAADDLYVREGDEIVVPSESHMSSTMTITGAVTNAQTTVYKKGDKLSMLLRLGGRCTNVAGGNKAFLVRDGSRTELSIDDKLSLLGKDMDAQPGDLIVIEQDLPTSVLKFGAVSVRGEVLHPGSFPIEQNVTRVKDVLDLVGGFTSDAYLSMGFVLRREQNDAPLLQNEYTERLKKMQYTNLVLEDTVRFTIDELARKPLVSCDLSKALSNPSSPDNVVLQDGDVVVIPRNPRSVFVYGQVKNGGYLQYVPGRTMEEYIAAAGGMTAEADKGRERIIKGKTGVWLKSTETVVEAGDKIYVPHPPDEPLGQQVQRMSSYVTAASAIVGAIMTAINIYLTLKK